MLLMREKKGGGICCALSPRSKKKTKRKHLRRPSGLSTETRKDASSRGHSQGNSHPHIIPNRVILFSIFGLGGANLPPPGDGNPYGGCPILGPPDGNP